MKKADTKICSLYNILPFETVSSKMYVTTRNTQTGPNSGHSTFLDGFMSK